MVKRVLTSIITVAVLMVSLVACGGSDSDAELREKIADLEEELEEQIEVLAMQSDTSELEAALEAQQEQIEALETVNEELRELVQSVENSGDLETCIKSIIDMINRRALFIEIESAAVNGMTSDTNIDPGYTLPGGRWHDHAIRNLSHTHDFDFTIGTLSVTRPCKN